MSDLIAHLESEARDLLFPRFDETLALNLGQVMVARARAARLPVVIDIRSANRTLFHAALPGSAALQENWARRKSATALMFGEASYLVGQRNFAKGESLLKHGLDLNKHADHGGAVPILVRGVGLVAVATVSGLPQADDHALVVEALRAILATLTD